MPPANQQNKKRAAERPFSAALRSSRLPESQEQPRLSPQFRHLKQAPLRTATLPQVGHVGASFIKWAMASLKVVIARPWTEPFPLRAPLPESLPGLSAITSVSSDNGRSGTGRFTFFFSSSSSPGIESSG